jgi:hypothetical protein
MPKLCAGKSHCSNMVVDPRSSMGDTGIEVEPERSKRSMQHGPLLSAATQSAASSLRSLRKERRKTTDHTKRTGGGDVGIPSEEQPAVSLRQQLAGACDLNPTITEDMCFFDAWERGLQPGLSAIFRARQIRRVNPV